MKQNGLELPEPPSAQPCANDEATLLATLESRANLQGLVVVACHLASLELRSDLHDLISFVAVFLVVVSVLHSH
jgi:hypothetical protein